MPSVRLGRLVGAGHADAPVADATVRAPHLLAVHDVLVAVALGPRAQAGEVATRAGFAEQLAPHALARDGRPQVLALLLVGAEQQQRPPASTTPTMLMNGGTPGERALLDPRRRVLGREAAAAVFARASGSRRSRRRTAVAATPSPRPAGRAGGWRRSHAARAACWPPATRPPRPGTPRRRSCAPSPCSRTPGRLWGYGAHNRTNIRFEVRQGLEGEAHLLVEVGRDGVAASRRGSRRSGRAPTRRSSSWSTNPGVTPMKTRATRPPPTEYTSPLTGQLLVREVGHDGGHELRVRACRPPDRAAPRSCGSWPPARWRWP